MWHTVHAARADQDFYLVFYLRLALYEFMQDEDYRDEYSKQIYKKRAELALRVSHLYHALIDQYAST